MTLLDRYLTRQFLPVLLGALAFFVLILELADLFNNFSRYLSNEVPFASILWAMALYVPKCLSFALPIALLFAVAFTMGHLYANNELIAIFSSGIPLARLTLPLVAVGLALSAFSLWFEDAVVIAAVREKNAHTRTMLKQKVVASNSNISLLAKGGKVVWKIDYYNDENSSLSGVSVLIRDGNGDFASSVNAQSASWDPEGGTWILRNATRYYWKEGVDWLTSEFLHSWTDPALDEKPETFRRPTDSVDEMTITQAAAYVERKKASGFPYSGDLAEYWKRWAFSLTPFVVVFISCAIGGRFRKNILLMSLTTSLMASVLFYVTQMVTMLLAKFERIPPHMGGWLPVIAFTALGFALFRSART